MSNKEFFDNHFFVVDSNNCSIFKSNMYGFKVVKTKKEPATQHGTFFDYGAYINIISIDNKLIIEQDYWGCYGLYLYKNENYFAISNSFLYLVNFINRKFKLSINREYFEYFILDPLGSLSYDLTPIQEVSLLKKNCKVIIDIKKKNLAIEDIEQNIPSYAIDSAETFTLLDMWYSKYSNLLARLIHDGKNVSMDISGGMDSRAVSTLCESVKNDLRKMRFHSIDDGLYTHGEDYEIASKFAKLYNFDLNNSSILNIDDIHFDTNSSILVSFLTKLGFHNQYYFKRSFHKNPIYAFTGAGGEKLRNHWKDQEDVFISQRLARDKFFSFSVGKSTEKVLQRTLESVAKYSGDLMNNVYRHTRMRSHFGKSIVENYISNEIVISPLMDPSLDLINIDEKFGDEKYLLLAIIYLRYMPNVLNIKFDSHKSIDKNILNEAENISKKYSLQRFSTDYTIISGTQISPDKSFSPPNPKGEILRQFFTSTVRKTCDYMLSSELYDNAVSMMEDKRKHFNHSLAMSIVSFSLLQQILSHSSCDISFPFQVFEKNISSHDNISKIFLALRTLRCDIKNIGTENDIKFLNPQNYYSKKEKWFTNHSGAGYVINSSKLEMDVHIKCIHDGQLVITLRGPDIRDYSKERILTNVLCLSVKIDGKECLLQPTVLNHDKVIKYCFPVIDNEEHIIRIKWAIYPYDKQELIQVIDKLYTNLHALNYDFLKS